MAGKPVLAIMDAKMEVARDILDGGCGYIVNNGESDELAEKIQYLLENGALRRQMGRAAREIFIKKYEKDICLKQYVNLGKKGSSKNAGDRQPGTSVNSRD